MRRYLINAREKAGLSQQDVAEKIGLSRQYYQMIEVGKRQPKLDITLVSKLSQLLGIEISEIIRLEEHATTRTTTT